MPTVSAPVNSPKAVAVLSTPATIGPCDVLRLDASFSHGSAGRALILTWSVNETLSSVTSADAASLQSELQVRESACTYKEH